MPFSTEQVGGFTDAAVLTAREDLLAYCMLMDPNFVLAPHHLLMAEALEQVEKGKIKRLMIFISPRSTKSYMSQRFQSWCMGRNPTWQEMALSYNKKLADTTGREVRNLVQSDQFKKIFPAVEVRSDSRAAERWETTTGGIYVTGGITSGIAGRGANLAVIDDPLSEQDAWRKSSREFVKNWYPGGLRTRLMPNGRIVIIQTRWHEDDLSGWLLANQDKPNSDKWTVIDIPAILGEQAAMKLEAKRAELVECGWMDESYPAMKAGESYWPPKPEHLEMEDDPERQAEVPTLRGWKTQELIDTRDNMPPYQWNALYMQKPSSEEGGILKRTYWKRWHEAKPPQIDYVLMSMDTAYTERESGDYSALSVWGVFKDGKGISNMVLVGGDKGRWAYPDLRQRTLDYYNQFTPDAILIERKASGQSLIADMRLAGVPVLDYLPDKDGDKVARAHACTPLLNAGRIWIPDNGTKAAQTGEDIMEECAVFPNGANDDYVDCTTQAILWLRNGRWVQHPTDPRWDEETSDEPKTRKFYS